MRSDQMGVCPDRACY